MQDKEIIKYLRKYFPERVFQRIKQSRGKTELKGERRKVTILFGDLCGFTALTEKLKDPEEIVKIINRYFTRMLEIVEKYGGDLDKLIGDAVMVLFGAPVSHKDDSLRAVSAALEMVDSITELGSVDTPEGKVDINISIGINTGEVVALNMGSDKRMEYTVMGDAVNTASRLEGIASPGEIIISENTYSEVSQYIDCEALRPMQLKGKEEPVRAYRVLGKREKGIVTEFELPFVNREDEKDYIYDLINEVKAGGSKKLSVLGPFGVGKSRMIREVTEEKKGIRIVHLKGRQFRPDISFYPIVDYIKEEYREKIPGNLKIFKGEEEIKEDYRERAENAWNEYLKGMLNVSPVMIWLEDWDYMDQTTKKLFENLKDYEGLFLVTDGSKGVNGFDKVELKNFDERVIKGLIEDILNYSVSKNFIDFLYSNSEGNPYSLRLLMEWIIDNKLYEKVGSRLEIKEGIRNVPDGIQAFMSEKLDSLPENIRMFLKNASVFGMSFNLNVYKEIFSESREWIDGVIEETINAGIISKSGDIYSFRSIPLREAAYDSVLKKEKEKLHREIAFHLEDVLGKNAEEWASLLAYHFTKGGFIETAVEYLKIAGDRARRYSDFTSAMKLYRKAEDIYEKLDNGEGRMIIKQSISSVYCKMGRFKRALEEIKKALEIGESIESERLPDLYNISGVILRDMDSLEESEEYFKKSIEYLKKERKIDSLAMVYQNLAGIYLKRSRYEDAISMYGESSELAIQSDRLDVSAESLFNLGHIYDITGKKEKAEKSYRESLDIWRRLKDRDGEARTLVNLGVLHLFSGKYEIAERNLNDSLKIAEETGNVEYRARANLNLGILHSYKGQMDESLKMYKTALEDFREIDSRGDLVTVLANIAEIHEYRAELNESERYYKEAMKGAEELEDRYTMSYLLTKIGRINLWKGMFNDSLSFLLRGVKIADEIGVNDFKYDAFQFIARTYIRIGLKEKAEAYFKRIDFDDISNYEVKGRYIITDSLIKEAESKGDEVFDRGEELINLGEETGNIGFKLDGLGTLVRSRILNDEEIRDVIIDVEEVISESDFIVRNLWVMLSIGEFYLDKGEYDRASITFVDILEKAEKRNLGVIYLNACTLKGKLEEMMGNEEEAIKYYQEAADIVLKQSENLSKELKTAYIEKNINIFDRLIDIYYKKINETLIIDLLRKLPGDIIDNLLDKRIDENPEITEKVLKSIDRY